MHGTASVAIGVSVLETLPMPSETSATSGGMASGAVRQTAGTRVAASSAALTKRSAALATSRETTSTSSCPMGMAPGSASRMPETFRATLDCTALATSEAPVEAPFRVVTRSVRRPAGRSYAAVALVGKDVIIHLNGRSQGKFKQQ